MSYFVTISAGRFEVHSPRTSSHSGYGEHTEEPVCFEPTDEGREAMRAYLKERGIVELNASSALDFPDEGGLSEGFDAHGFVEYALEWPSVRVSVALTDLEEMERRLASGDTESVLEAVRGWIKAVKDQQQEEN